MSIVLVERILERESDLGHLPGAAAPAGVWGFDLNPGPLGLPFAEFQAYIASEFDRIAAGRDKAPFQHAAAPG